MKKTSKTVKVSDVVVLDFTKVPGVQSKGKFLARILEMQENASGHTIIRYERTDGEAQVNDLCNVSFITEISATPYVRRPLSARTNIFADARLKPIVVRRGGMRVGEFSDLCEHALAGVTHVDLETPFNEWRARQLYTVAGFPGQVATDPSCPHWMWAVRWKTFQRWVRQNASRLVLTKKERAAKRAAYNKAMSDDLYDALMADEAKMERREGDEQDRGSSYAFDDRNYA